ncbi:hypothetical protein LTR91_006152 [Friedmanniomyces endolithicus]|uniref:Probable transporter MCH1 n=1 Tax=Friedmanniomyces endolithicus TaxID=329885 RepID=A0A4U0UKT6_9PEZI|nr:hypothetical protein LTS09_011129 [Friedmanniomyces endolithicus]KAK0308599.1 hypothetical protein LTR82_015538 [Friedmanniomyces endolithicus]KAK0311376.1 hypothetical protein LTR01_003372 [Friedmanniomyces endolithicus]KAK0828615.1 hypothetical protein LTR73_004924 [Friedmanniomyces endolithicus]KAK0924419.1 hypothetical protein LTR57_005938 [Friedmanniomyces endolithicus]
MPSRSASRRRSNDSGTPHIDKLDYHPGGRLLQPHHHDANHTATSSGHQSPSYAGSFFEEIAEGIATQQRQRLSKEVLRYLAFAWAIVNCLGAGSITAYSLYAPLFQKRLHYTQLQVNGVSITAELAMYLPVPLWGMLCDRLGPGIPSLVAGTFFGVGYILAAFAYASGGGDGDGAWPYWVMVVAFIPIGFGTSCMYLSAVTTCAKNFGRGKYKGLALALPIACFGLSGMWESQIGSNLLYERRPDGGKGDVDVYRFFLFLGCLLLGTGVVGFFALRIVGEEELIDEAVEELEQSGLLADSSFFQPQRSQPAGYGTVATGDRRLSVEEVHDLHQKASEHKAWLAEQERKKTWLLNEETRLFLGDHTMWWLAAGFFLVTGPGEAFINNLGTIIGTLYPPPTSSSSGWDTTGDVDIGADMTTAATHVSIVAITSTLARILTGTLTDLLAPTSSPHQHRRGPGSLANSTASLLQQPSDLQHSPPSTSGRLEVSRLTFLITFTLLMSAGQLLLATGFLQGHGGLFWLVSASIGAGYGAAFSLVPIIISVVWGVENFGTNWGIVATVPAAGATIWGLVYGGAYQWAADRRVTGSVLGLGVMGVTSGDGGKQRAEDVLCYGAMCYAPTFWAMAASVWVACGLWLWAWRGPGGWYRRGILV